MLPSTVFISLIEEDVDDDDDDEREGGDDRGGCDEVDEPLVDQSDLLTGLGSDDNDEEDEEDEASSRAHAVVKGFIFCFPSHRLGEEVAVGAPAASSFEDKVSLLFPAPLCTPLTTSVPWQTPPSSLGRREA